MDEKEVEFFKQNGLEFIKIIGQGGYGVIYEVHSANFNSNFAVKKIPKCFFSQAELDCLMRIDDPRIVRLYQIYRYNDFIYMVLEYCPTDLYKVFSAGGKLYEEDIYRYAHDAVLAIKSVHDKNIAHCDIKPANFFIDTYGRVKIGDFGLASFNGSSCSCKMAKGTKLFMAPEVYCKKYTPMKSDIWSLGVTLYFLATQTYPFNAPDIEKLKQCISIGLFATDKVQNKNLLAVISKCLDRDPEKRPTADEILQMPYFKENGKSSGGCCSLFYKCARFSKNIVKPCIKSQRSFGSLQFRCLNNSRIKLSTSMDHLDDSHLIPVC
ncbi:protein serine/threonine kinase protein [Trichomonas vaginalis G3]|uniref:protein serine/threonine kinase protein n=1 Tax=Trichomonas vaginalis (strain ATCC PRA-98 / G3) TaxID=412133 RepID=UPI0021E5DC77|nr:protein serine/threonine kinase protein [Trichomonas vaginalis G3]KAI5547425.1 protein serine/threonine kinase protein [Trichomonas vaginalis G3]